ncbi:MAG: hypothetical protein ACKOEM_03900 [Planctomycetia bacterium]
MPSFVSRPNASALRHLPTRALICATFLGIASAATFAGEDLLLPVKGKDGKPSPLFQKVVVTSDYAKLCKQGPGCNGGDPVEPYSIFYKLKTPAGGEEQDGWVRVGDSKGTSIGWIQRTNAKGEAVLKDWATRFVLEPNEPTPDREFRVQTQQGTLKLNIVPAGKRRFAFITSASDAKGSDDTDYDVFVCTATVQQERGAMASEAKKLENLKLEVVFVIEGTDFLLNKLDDMLVGDAIKQVILDCIAEIEADGSLKDAARLGIVEYQDKSPKATLPNPRVTCRLTSDMATVKSALTRLDPVKIEGDFPEDMLGGLQVAIDDAGWDPLSCKHVVLLGFASAQLYPQGQSPGNFPGLDNAITRRAPPPEERGWNGSGLTIDQLIARANPQGGSADDRARAQRTFHTVRITKPIRNELVDQLVKEAEFDRARANEIVNFAANTVKSVLSASDTTLDSALEQAGDALERFAGDELNIGPVIRVGAMVNAFETDERLALAQYRTIAANDDIQGLFEAVPPRAAELKRVASKLKSSLAEAFSVLAKIRDRTIDSADDLQGAGAFSQTFYSVVGANAERFKPQTVEVGRSRTRADDGREVAKRKVMVGRDELQKLRARLDSIYSIFSKKIAKKDRQSVNETLDELKQAIAGAAAGQIVADTNLQEVITDLPLTTDVLRITPEQIATFSSDRFKAWLDGLKRSIDRAQALLDRRDNWLPLSSLAAADEVSFLSLTELP